MNAQDFEKILQKLDPRLTVVDNPNRPGLSNIFFEGKNYDLPVISTFDIRDDVDTTHVYEFPNGLRARFWSKAEILGRIEQFLKNIERTRADYAEEE